MMSAFSSTSPAGATVINGSVLFQVWAPHARAVAVAGDFCDWDPHEHTMSCNNQGVWSVVCPHAKPGDLYKFVITDSHGDISWRVDPRAVECEAGPVGASKIYESRFLFTDHQWMARQNVGPLSIYELHVGSLGPAVTYRGIAQPLADYVEKLGFTHIEFMPLGHHPHDGSWGYHLTSFFAPNSRFGTVDDLKYLINYLHSRNIGVIMDWVCVHFAPDPWALARFDGTVLYEHPDPEHSHRLGWGSFAFNLADATVREFLIDSACYWISEFHLDGLRMDAIAALLTDAHTHLQHYRARYSGGPTTPMWTYKISHAPAAREHKTEIGFLRQLNARIGRDFPRVLKIAEDSSATAGVTAPINVHGLGFDYAWDMPWMNHSLHLLSTPPDDRALRSKELWAARGHTTDVLPGRQRILALSHDEVVHGKGSLLDRCAHAHHDPAHQQAMMAAYFAHMWALDGAKLVFSGMEFGQSSQWDHVEGLPWPEAGTPRGRMLTQLISTLNRLHRECAELWTGSCAIDAPAENISLITRCDSDFTLCAVTNWSDQPAHVQMSSGGQLILATDASAQVDENTLYSPGLSCTWIRYPTSPTPTSRVR